MKGIEKVAVLGAGNGGCAAAAVLTQRGYEVRLYSPTERRLGPLRQGITLTHAYEGLVRPFLMTTDLGTAVCGADLVMLVVPAVAHEGYARRLAPVLERDQIIFLNPGHTGGGLHFANELKKWGAPGVPLCESVTLTYICRMEGEATVGVYRETENLRFAALPAHQTGELIEKLHPLFPNLRSAVNVLETGLMNINAVIHPPGMLMNAGWIEFMKGEFLFYKESITPSVARVIEEVDAERLAVSGALGLQLPAFIDFFCEAGLTTEAARQSRSVYRAMRESEANRSIKSPDTLKHRYVDEDVGYGLVPMSQLGGLLGIGTPAMNSLIVLASIARQRDFDGEGLSVESMGLSGLSAAEIMAML